MTKGKNGNGYKLAAAALIVAIVYLLVTFAGRGGKSIEGSWQGTDDLLTYSMTLYGTGYGEVSGIGGMHGENVSWTYEGNTLTLVPEDLLQNETCSYNVRWDDGDMLLLSDSFSYTLEKIG